MNDSRLEGFTPVVELMHRIQESGNMYPKVRLSFGLECPLVFTVCGVRSRSPGDINLTDGGSYDTNKWFGRITMEGELRPGEAMRNLPPDQKKAFWDLLCRLRDGQAEGVFAEYGHAFGSCCMCGRELTNEESVAMGIGPVCRSKAFGGN